MIDYYCIPSCDKCRKARKLLIEKNISYQEVDMRKDGLSEVLIGKWVGSYGVETILNRRSATWRDLDESVKLRISDNPAEVINMNAAMLHRPILDFGDHILVNKEALEWLEMEDF